MTNEAEGSHTTLSAPVIAIEWEEALRSLRSSESYRTADHTARTLAKHHALRIVLVAMRAGGRMDEHHTGSAISVHCLQGRFRFDVSGTIHDLGAGQILVVGEGMPHSVTAAEECAFY